MVKKWSRKIQHPPAIYATSHCYLAYGQVPDSRKGTPFECLIHVGGIVLLLSYAAKDLVVTKHLLKPRYPCRLYGWQQISTVHGELNILEILNDIGICRRSGLAVTWQADQNLGEVK